MEYEHYLDEIEGSTYDSRRRAEFLWLDGWQMKASRRNRSSRTPIAGVCVSVSLPRQAKKATKEAQKERRKHKIKKHVKQQRIKNSTAKKK